MRVDHQEPARAGVACRGLDVRHLGLQHLLRLRRRVIRELLDRGVGPVELGVHQCVGVRGPLRGLDRCIGIGAVDPGIQGRPEALVAADAWGLTEANAQHFGRMRPVDRRPEGVRRRFGAVKSVEVRDELGRRDALDRG